MADQSTSSDSGATGWDAVIAFFHSLGDLSDMVGIVLIMVCGIVLLVAIRYATKVYGDKLRMEIEAKKQEDNSVPVSLFEKLLTELAQTLTASGSQYEGMRLQMGKLESEMGTLSDEIRRSADTNHETMRIISTFSEKLTDMTEVMRDLIQKIDMSSSYDHHAPRRVRATDVAR